MFNRPFSRTRDKSGGDFKPEDHELAVLEPFLEAPKSVFADVQKAVFDSEVVQPGRRDSLLELYKVLRADRLAEMGGGGSERKA